LDGTSYGTGLQYHTWLRLHGGIKWDKGESCKGKPSLILMYHKPATHKSVVARNSDGVETRLWVDFSGLGVRFPLDIHYSILQDFHTGSCAQTVKEAEGMNISYL
jgi:hypothetical protein